MAAPTFQKKLLPGVIALALAGAPFQHLLAADEAADAKDKDAEVVEVRGIRDSMRVNLAEKRDADDIREVITAEEVGKFPDKNIAESLQRITGIGIQRDFGEGSRVSIRGTAPNLNRTLLNGHSIATADWFILDQLNATRSFNYEMLPSELVGSMEVIKSPQADVEEGSIGGLVNIQTLKPLQLPSLKLAGSYQEIFNEKADEMNPSFSGLASWKNDNNNFGVLVSAIHSESDVRRDGIEVLGYSDVDLGGGVGIAAIPDLIGSAYFTQKRERDAFNVTAQWAPRDDLDITFNALHAKVDADNINSNFLAWFSHELGAGNMPTGVVVDSHGTAVAGSFDNDADWGAVYDVFVREGSTQTDAYDLDVTYEIGNWKLHGKLGTTDADGETSRQLIWETLAKTGFSWDLRGGAPLVDFTNISDSYGMDANGWNGERDVGNSDSEDFLYAEAEWQLDNDFLNALKFGIKATEHDRDISYNGEVGHGLYGDTSCNGGICNVDAVGGGILPGDFMSGYNVFGGYRLVDPDRLYAIYNSVPSQGACEPGQTYPPSCYSNVASSSYAVAEDALGAFIMAKFSGEKFKGNFGVRVVQTDVSADGVSTGIDANTPGAQWNFFDGYYVANTEKADYTDVLPSFNIKYSLSEDQILRFAAAKVMARPDYSAMAPNISLNSTSYTGSGGNPGLDPYRAKQYDLSYEWYLSDSSIFSAAYFYKKIDSYITSNVFEERHASFFEAGGPVAPDPARCDDLGGDVWNCLYRITRPSNGDGGKNEGWELAYQHTFESGFGFSGNYTKVDAEADDGSELPGSAKHTYNLAAFFENQLLSARLSYNARDDFFVGIDHSREQWMEASSFIDASIAFNLNEHVQFTLQGQNITDEEIVMYYDGLKSRPNAVYQTGPTYFAGIRVSY